MSKQSTDHAIRFFDIAFATIGLLVGSPILLILIVIGLVDTGSPFFLQLRVGLREKPFTLIKFRTMKKDTPSVATHLSSYNSITKTGKFLRKTKLDELPQLINVLFGQMSIVGPRPGLQNQTELTNERKKFNVFRAKPGITGLGQTLGIDMSTPRKLARYDNLMIKKINLALYFYLISVTIFGRGQGDRIKPK